MLPHKPTSDLIDAALAEDIGPGDVTATFFVPEFATATARIVAREAGVAAGVAVAAEVFRRVDPALAVSEEVADGDALDPGTTLLRVTGRTRSLLTAERTALNFLSRLCGVATQTRRYVEAVRAAGATAAVLDTRKTTPGWRHLEKAAVRAGGGQNHRMGLYDRVMVKDNHLLAEGQSDALQEAIDAARDAHPGITVELEADTLDQVRLFLGLRGVDIILLDNMTPDELRAAVALVADKVALEASGGITPETVGAVAATGVNFVSAGALTHSAPALDLSLTLEEP